MWLVGQDSEFDVVSGIAVVLGEVEDLGFEVLLLLEFLLSALEDVVVGVLQFEFELFSGFGLRMRAGMTYFEIELAQPGLLVCPNGERVARGVLH